MTEISDERISQILANGFELRHDEIHAICRRALEAESYHKIAAEKHDEVRTLREENAALRDQLAALLLDEPECGEGCRL